MENIIINVSGFSHDNPEHCRIWENEIQPVLRDRSMEIHERMFLATQRSYPISKPGMQELEVSFASWHRQPRNTPWMFGVYCSGGEPSLTCELSVADEQAITQVKLRTIEFGERYKQKNVHVLRSFDRLLDFGESIAIAEDETCELCWLASLNQMNDSDAVFKMAEDAGLEDLSITSLGTQLLIYTLGNIGGGPPSFEEAYKGALLKLRRKLFARGLLSEGREKLWHVRLSNYGTQCHKTHDYPAAKRLLLNNKRI